MLFDRLLDYEEEAVRLSRWFLRRKSVKIDNVVFFLHYNVTVTFLLSAVCLVTAGLYIGDPIECISDSTVEDVIDSFCWVHSTFTVAGRWNHSSENEVMVAHPGVMSSNNGQMPIKFHGYYQWVSYVLGIQALIFCISKFLWESWEGGRLEMLLSHAKEGFSKPVSPDDNRLESELKYFFLYFQENIGNHNFYFRKLLICEALNLFVAISQFLLTNLFLGYELTNVSLKEALRIFTVSDPLHRNDHVAQIFPKVTKCTFNVHGPSGDVQNHDALCVLPFNVINEKIYLVLGLWLVILMSLSAAVLIYRAFLFVPTFRMAILKQSTNWQEIESFHMLRIKLKIGDWFLLHQLGRNMDYVQFTELIKLLNKKICE